MRRLVPLAFVLVGCKGAPKPAVRVTFDELCTDKYKPGGDEAEPKLSRYTVEGYLAAPKMMACSTQDCSLWLYGTQALDGAHISVSFAVGDGANEMSKLPERFTPDDVKVHTNDGKTLGIGAKVRVTAQRLGFKPTDCQLIKTDLVEAP